MSTHCLQLTSAADNIYHSSCTTTTPTLAMSFTSQDFSDNLSICVDPKLLVYGAGLGFDEPFPSCDFTIFANDQTIDLPQTDQQCFQARSELSIGHDAGSDEDAEHESIDEFPLKTRPSLLDPEAPAFVPAGQFERDAVTQTQEEPGLEPLRPVESPPTPRIEVSRPNDTSFGAIECAVDDRRQKSRPQSRQSSPRGQSPSITRPRAQSTNRKRSAMPKAVATKLITALEDLPANRQYNVGDRTAPLVNLHGHASYPPTMAQLYPGMPGFTTGAKRPGYACSHDGCPESGRRWDTRSDRDHHERKHVPVDRRAHACEHCGKTFHFPKDLNRHMVVHDGSKVICPVCNKAYSRNDNLKRHIKSQHGRVGSMGSTSQMSAYSPTPSLVTSFTQSPIDDTGRSSPWNLSPAAAKSNPWSKYAHNRHDSVNEPLHEDYVRPESPLSAQPMSKSFSNRT